MKIRNTQFHQNRTYIMGIVNVTPDSFFDGGQHNRLEDAIRFSQRLIEEGADILDVGGESTRPGFTPVGVQEEIDRTASFIARLRTYTDVPISIDTYKADVARAGIDAGADIVNDIWGLQYERSMAGVIAKSGSVCVLGHNREKGGYSNFSTEFDSELQQMIQRAKSAGIGDDKIIVDPGIGFCKTANESICAFRQILQNDCGYPVLIGASNKSMIGEVLNLPLKERLYGTLATTAYAVAHGARFVRVHQVQENRQLIDMLQALSAGQKE